MSAIAIYKVPIKKAVKLIKDWETNSKSCIPNPETSNAIEYLISQDRCTNCGKRLIKIGEYEWHCKCMPKNLRISIG